MKNSYLVLVIVFIITQLFATIFISEVIKKHSVHPEFGEYEQKKYNCYPWDSCIKPLMTQKKYCFIKKFLYTDVKEL